MINLNRSLKQQVRHLVKPFEIHKVIHRFCGQLWKSTIGKHREQNLNCIVQNNIGLIT